MREFNHRKIRKLTGSSQASIYHKLRKELELAECHLLIIISYGLVEVDLKPSG